MRLRIIGIRFGQRRVTVGGYPAGNGDVAALMARYGVVMSCVFLRLGASFAGGGGAISLDE